MTVYNFKVLLEPDEGDGGLRGFLPLSARLLHLGDTIDEALENIKEAICCA